MKIYTGTGDGGETGLFGGERVSKNAIRIEAYGTIDELNAFIGLTIIEVSDKSVKDLLQKIQNWLFSIGADLATPDDEKTKKLNVFRTPKEYYLYLEKEIDKYESKLDELRNFILPGGTKGAALLHICRTITRRAERMVVALNSTVKIGNNIIIFLNRLSDLFFVLARFDNAISGTPDIKWNQ
ncbi:MAG: cob(I)yrinic acid a,c-diamide adenosyltransferase [Ignavibacteriaceae bacterium]|jgi:cob(I)alamin adenosyltransferase|nr:cob(I)yrinic acid a,c-diamide adenosyltransferase [Ignavibacteriaceae bacterium]